MCHASSNLTTTFVYHFVGLDGCCYVVFELSTTQCILSKFSGFSFESATIFKMDLRTNTPSTYMCNVGYSSCDLLASVLPILPLFWRKVPTFLFRLYCLQKTFLKKSGRIGKKGRNAWLSHQLSYYFYSFPQNYYHKFLGRCSFNMNYYIS